MVGQEKMKYGEWNYGYLHAQDPKYNSELQ